MDVAAKLLKEVAQKWDKPNEVAVMFTENAKVLQPMEELIEGRKAIVSMLAQRVHRFPNSKMDINVEEVAVDGKELISVRTTVKLTVSGHMVGKGKGVFLISLREAKPLVQWMCYNLDTKPGM